LRDQLSNLRDERRVGREEGLREGWEKGREEGRKEGIQQGKYAAALEMIVMNLSVSVTKLRKN
jgi:flagellar biosynthesis/type III secretory pathway protein FliH